ncbi:DEAD/DEAH box helicase [Flexithrix dorotheae]|uniref:DEAD/DEAH box helicase n=1 Tax=Flexithrix dorotheae TaxID=70993 RepID=UPI000363918F|nr:DEAD/DEAH box helicase [Flexithrix dorotheae]
MVVSPDSPFQIVYSLFQHQYLGYLFESFVVELSENGKLTLKHQNISHLNAHEFASGLDDTDYKLIELMDSIQQEAIIKKFYKKKALPAKFFEDVYLSKRKDEGLIRYIDQYIESRRGKILDLLAGKELYEMANDGNPTHHKIEVQHEKATVLFHFRRNEDNTHYFPTIKYKGEKVDFQYKNGILICNEPAWLMLEGKLFTFEKNIDGNKLKPFLNKKFIAIPRSMEDTYYKKFVTPLIESFDVYAKGFDIKSVYEKPFPNISLSEMAGSSGVLFGNNGDTIVEDQEEKIIFTLGFNYDKFKFTANKTNGVSVKLEKKGDNFTFYRVNRNIEFEKSINQKLEGLGLTMKNGKAVMEKSKAFSFISDHLKELESAGINVKQPNPNGKKYFLGQSRITLEINENKDWFDINAIVKFGEYEIPFLKLRKLIISNKKEFVLPNGEVAVIPDTWFTQYSDLFNFIDEDEQNHTLKKHHVAMVQELKAGSLAKVSMSRKLEQLRDFSKIESSDLSSNFTGELRPYQKAGYDWLQFLGEYKFGGCLADDMGLGKTVQTLAMLQKEKDQNNGGTSLLIMPTSLLYNWEMEAKKFTPNLKVFSYTGSSRNKDLEQFSNYDLILTSYGIVRIDVDILENFYFNYIILDESQVIKNPTSIIAKSVNQLKSNKRLILTGTPIENTTMDLWSQMNFVNPGLLGNQKYFKKEYQLPIEKRQDELKSKKLHALIKPFIMRRHKSQVAKDLPEKIEKIQYSSMTKAQEEEYEETKSIYRNKILDQIETSGVSKSQMLLLQGLTMLRQLANHPKMVNPDSKSDSGKLEDVIHMLNTAIEEGHKILIFSQFVKHLNILKDYLIEKKLCYAYLDGSTKNRQEQVDKFQNNPDLKLFLISLKAGGLGLNLTAADYVFILDPWWNPAIEAQAIDRAHRIGQENKVVIYKFITKNSVEEKIIALQNSKLRLANELIKTEESFIKNLSKNDIEALLS